MNLKCIAIDDEPMALEIISNFCQRVGNIDLLTFTNPYKGMEEVRKKEVDLVFLDVKMGEVSGLKLAENLPTGISLIFTTAYSQYAIDGFDLEAVDFLHKPFSFFRFKKAVQKVLKLKQHLSANSIFTDEEIVLKVEYKNCVIKLKDILYIESMDNYVKIHLMYKQPVMSQLSMKSLQEMLPEDKFVRVHKSYIVPTYRIASYTSKQINLSDGRVIPVGRSFYKDIVVRGIKK